MTKKLSFLAILIMSLSFNASASIFDKLVRKDKNFKCNLKVNPYLNVVIDEKVFIYDDIFKMKAENSNSAKKMARIRMTNDEQQGANLISWRVLETNIRNVVKNQASPIINPALHHQMLPYDYYYDLYVVNVKVEQTVKKLQKKTEDEISNEVCQKAIDCESKVKTRGERKAYEEIKEQACR